MIDQIEKSVDLHADIERVWTALTDYQQFGAWFRVKLDGPFAADTASTGHITYPSYEHIKWQSHIRQLRRPDYFSFTWHPFAVEPDVDYSGETPTLVEFKLARIPDGTQLVVTESGFSKLPVERQTVAREMNEGGWEEQMRNIRDYLQG